MKRTKKLVALLLSGLMMCSAMTVYADMDTEVPEEIILEETEVVDVASELEREPETEAETEIETEIETEAVAEEDIELMTEMYTLGYADYQDGCMIESCTGYGDTLTVTMYAYGKKVLAVGYNAFRSNTDLVTFGRGYYMTAYLDGAFAGCSNLQNISFDEITLIGNDAFRGCKSLHKDTGRLELANGLTSIGAYAFFDCTGLYEVVIPPSVTSIGEHAFDKFNANAELVANTDITIYGNPDSTAQQYAKAHGMKFIPTYFNNSTVGNLKAVGNGKRSVKLTWTTPTDFVPEGYVIYAKKNGVYAYCGIVAGGNTNTFIDAKASDVDYNFYWVYPYCYDAQGKLHVALNKKLITYVYAKGNCTAVENLKAASAAGAVKLTWNPVPTADGYLVYGFHGSPHSGATYGYIGYTKGQKVTTYLDRKALKTDYNYYYVFPFHYSADGKMIPGQTAKYVWGKAR